MAAEIPAAMEERRVELRLCKKTQKARKRGKGMGLAGEGLRVMVEVGGFCLFGVSVFFRVLRFVEFNFIPPTLK